MKSVILTVVAMFFCCCLSAEEPIIKFGVVTDMHYSPKHPENKKHPTRSYKLPKAKLQEAVNTFNQEKVAFTAILGDNIDLYAESFYELKPVLAQLDKPHHIVLGNHDFLDFYGTPKQDSVLKILGVKKPYYSFVKTIWLSIPVWRIRLREKKPEHCTINSRQRRIRRAISTMAH